MKNPQTIPNDPERSRTIPNDPERSCKLKPAPELTDATIQFQLYTLASQRIPPPPQKNPGIKESLGQPLDGTGSAIQINNSTKKELKRSKTFPLCVCVCGVGATPPTPPTPLQQQTNF